MAIKLCIYKFEESSSLTDIREEAKSADMHTSGADFVATINPSTVRFGTQIDYGTDEDGSDKPPGTAHPHLRYMGHEPENLSFKLILDGTGVIPDTMAKGESVNKQIENFKGVVYDYDGSEHTPNSLLITWGETFVFACRLKSLDISYTMFDTDGSALRAELSVSFLGTTKPEEAQARMNNSSPDLSHVRTVRAGDTLPLMCRRIYGDSQHYWEVAKANGLVNFRNLQPGTEILFPPIKK